MPLISVKNVLEVTYLEPETRTLRKGIHKSKLQTDINLLLKRGKIAGKAILHNLIFPHLSSLSASSISHGQHHSRGHRVTPPPTEYEFSCSNTPAHSFPIFHSKRNNKHSLFLGCVQAPWTEEGEDQEEAIATANALKMVLEMINNHNEVASNNDEKPERMMVQPSPALPGFGKTPAVPVRQLRVTDSPFPIDDVGGDRQVDEKADKFIAKFYSDLKRQRILATPSPGRPWW
uniref:Avr9/Cf-9 rapidly elicited protein 146 n=1 Tax=Kalanchoe fedtschenkoi TaxID=63787 RepID=A0A7N0VJ29_KALFE